MFKLKSKTTTLCSRVQDVLFSVEFDIVGMSGCDTARLLATIVGTNGGYFEADNFFQVSFGTSAWRVADIITDKQEAMCRLTSPKLRYAALPVLRRVVGELQREGAHAASNGGCCVRVDARLFSATQLCDLASLIHARQDILDIALGVSVERRKQRRRYISDLVYNLSGVTPNTLPIGDLIAVAYGRWVLGGLGRIHYRSGNSALNIDSMWQRGTIDFCLFNSTLNEVELLAYIDLSLALCDAALYGRATRLSSDIYADKSKEVFRSWLSYLGLTGVEFARTRCVLLSKLANLANTSKKRAMASVL